MTKAEHNRPIPKFFGNRPSASAAEVFGETIGLIIYLKISLELCLFSLFLSLKEAWLKKT
jgi:hypothetical protein